MCVIHYEVAHTLPGSRYTVNLQLFESMMFFVSSRFHSFSLFSNIFGFLQRHATLELLVFEVLGATMKYICHSVSEAKWNIANTMWLWASDASVHFLSSQNHILHWNLLHFGIRKIKDVGVRFLPHLCAAALAGTVSLGTLSATVMQRIVFHVPRHSSRRKQFIAWRLLPKSAAAYPRLEEVRPRKGDFLSCRLLFGLLRSIAKVGPRLRPGDLLHLRGRSPLLTTINARFAEFFRIYNICLLLQRSKLIQLATFRLRN